MDKAKPFDIPKREVWEAFKKVKANQGAAGVDGQTIADFEADLTNNLYKLWNRLSSGSYFPPPVRRVEIPKVDGGTRPLGIPTVADRVAQEVVRRYLEPRLEPVFHADSYGYRPGKSAIDAVRQARQRCWRYDWVLDLDVKAYFDSIDWELMLRAVRHHTNCPWVLLYIERWLKGSGSVGRWQRRAADIRNASGRGCQSRLGKSVPALCVRYVDEEKPILTSRSSATRTMLFVTARAPRRRRLYGARLPTALRPASWCCILRRQRSSTARMRTDAATSRTNRSIFSVSVSEQGKRCGKVIISAHGFMPAASPKALTFISRTIRRWTLHHRSDKSLQESGRDVQPVHSRLDQLLRQLLSNAVAFDPEED